MKKNGFSAGQIAAAYIGAVVGAGFATGQEVLQFFTKFGLFGILGLLAVSVLFFLFGAIVLDMGKRLNAQSHRDVIRYAGGRTFGTVIDVMITVSLFCTQTSMFAGCGAVCAQEFQIPAMWGGLLMACLAAFTVIRGFSGVVNANSLMVPLLLLIIVITCSLSLTAAPPVLTQTAKISAQGGLVKHWMTAAIVYVSYNSVLSVSVLSPLGCHAKGKRAIRFGALLGGFGLGAGALMIHLAMAGHLPDIARYEVPMVFIAGTLSKILRLLYIFTLVIAIYTTAVCALYGFAARFADRQANRGRLRIIVVASIFAALLSSNWGFANLVKYLYPVEGYAGIILLVCLLWRFLTTKIKRKDVRCKGQDGHRNVPDG